jgi:hypothetical protein
MTTFAYSLSRCCNIYLISYKQERRMSLSPGLPEYFVICDHQGEQTEPPQPVRAIDI